MQGTVIGLLFLGLSVAVHITGVKNLTVSFVLGVMACIAVIFLVAAYEGKTGKVMGFLAKYTMPIFLMHTLFAAPTRVVLMKMGITNAAVHVLLGIGISFAGPIVATCIMKKTKCLEFFLYPNKVIKATSKCTN